MSIRIMFNLIYLVMFFNQRKRVLTSKIPPVQTEKVQYLKDGCPVKRIVRSASTVVLNDVSVLSKLPQCDPDELEKALDTGVSLKQVSTAVMNPTNVEDHEARKVMSKTKAQSSSSNEE